MVACCLYTQLKVAFLISMCILNQNGFTKTYHKYLYISSLEGVDSSLHECEFHLGNDFSSDLMTLLN